MPISCYIVALVVGVISIICHVRPIQWLHELAISDCLLPNIAMKNNTDYDLDCYVAKCDIVLNPPGLSIKAWKVDVRQKHNEWQ